MLRQLAGEREIRLDDPARWLSLAFDVDWDLTARLTAGSAHPDAVKELLAAEVSRLCELQAEWAGRRARALGVARRLDELFASVPVGGATDGSG
jgi:argininosuccinate lyase